MAKWFNCYLPRPVAMHGLLPRLPSLPRDRVPELRAEQTWTQVRQPAHERLQELESFAKGMGDGVFPLVLKSTAVASAKEWTGSRICAAALGSLCQDLRKSVLLGHRILRNAPAFPASLKAAVGA